MYRRGRSPYSDEKRLQQDAGGAMFESVRSGAIEFQRFTGQQDTDSMYMLSYLYKVFKFYIRTHARAYLHRKIDG